MTQSVQDAILRELTLNCRDNTEHRWNRMPLLDDMTEYNISELIESIRDSNNTITELIVILKKLKNE